MRDQAAGKVICDQQCHEIVSKKLREDSIDHFRLVNYEVIPVCQVNGYMGQYFTLRATVACPKTPTDTRVYNFFTKTSPPPSSPQYDWNVEYGSFKKEVDLYTTVFPKVLDGLEKRSIPQCFLGRGNDIIVLEDMAHSGYSMTDKFVPFDFDHCLVAMRHLAKFHAKSIIFEEIGKRNLHEEFSHCMQETLWPMRDGMATLMFNAAVKGIVSMVDLMSGLDDQERRDFKERLQKLSCDHAKKLSPSSKFRNVLCHGDLWANNILFKYNDNGKPMACCLIDFQLARYNPPAHDILCFLQFTTTRHLRDHHMSSLLKIYWDELAASLKDAGVEVSTVLPWEELVASIAELRTMCMYHGVLNIPIMLLEPTAASKYFAKEPELLNNVLYVDRTPLICGQFHEIPLYKERMLDALLELYEFSS